MTRIVMNSDLHFYNFGIFHRISKENIFIFNAAIRFAQGKYPLMLATITSSEWLEKRHMKYSVYNRVKDKCLNLRLDEWTDLLIESIKSHSSEDFFNEMTKWEYMIIDNIEELRSKGSTTQSTFMDVLKKREKAKKHTLLISEHSYKSLEKWMVPELSHYLKKYKIVERLENGQELLKF